MITIPQEESEALLAVPRLFLQNARCFFYENLPSVQERLFLSWILNKNVCMNILCEVNSVS